VTGSSDDPGFARYLDGDSELSKQHRLLGREEPPAHVDARVLAEAAAAAGARSRRRRPLLWWLRPAALAATVVVSFALVLRLGQMPSIPSRPAADEKDPVPVQIEPPATTSPGPRPPAPGLAPATPPALTPRPAPAETALERAIVTAREREAESLTEAPAASTALDSATEQEDVAQQAGPEPPEVAGNFSAETIERAIVAIRARVGEQARRDYAQPGALAKAQEAAAATPEAEAADERLRTILALYDRHELDAVNTALVDFARDFPADPVTALLTKQPQ